MAHQSIWSRLVRFVVFLVFFCFNVTVSTEIYTLSLHDALPIYQLARRRRRDRLVQGLRLPDSSRKVDDRSEEHTSELQSPDQPVCRLLLEKKNKWHNKVASHTS